MGAIEQTIAEAVRIGVADAVKPLHDKIDALCKVIESQSAPVDEWVKQNELPSKLGNIGLTKVRQLFARDGAPKPNALGLHSVAEWRDFVKIATKDAA